MVGTHLLWRLLQTERTVRALCRPKSDMARVAKVFGYFTEDPEPYLARIQWVAAPLNDIPAMEPAFEGVDRVYHTAALISFDPGDFDSLQRTNVQGTANIVNLCIAHKIKKLCYVSSVAAIGNGIPGEMATENNAWNNEDPNVYALSKYKAELEVWRGTREGVPGVIVNPGVIVGPGFWNRGSGVLFSTADKGYAYYPPGGTGFIGIGDVIEAMVGLMAAQVEDQRYVLVSANWSYGKMLTTIAEGLGKPGPKKELKTWQLQIGRGFDALAHLLTRRGRKITAHTVRSLGSHDYYDSGKIKQAIGLEFDPLDAVIAGCCEKYLRENR